MPNQYQKPADAVLRKNAKQEPKFHSPSWWVPGEPPESYQAEWQQETARNLETIAQAIAYGKMKSKGHVLNLSRKLCVAPRFLLKWRTEPRMMKRVKELIKLRAVAGVAEALGYQIGMAKKDSNAFKGLVRLADLNPAPGPSMNVAIDARKMGDTDSDRKFFESYHRRIDTTSARLVSDGETEPN
jgi:hypothetical protein